ncbi:unnamed protein product, partial [marine sediment metagenome]
EKLRKLRANRNNDKVKKFIKTDSRRYYSG